MSSTQAWKGVLRRLGTTSLAACSDGVLLERFCSHGETDAFEALLDRHGPMVLGLCRRSLRDCHLADDVFQATFLLLARHAPTIRKGDSVSSWLHGVALRLTRKAQRGEATRRRYEAAAADQRFRSEDPATREMLLRLDEELERLPDRYRTPLLLCYLQGRTQEEAAVQLGWSRSTLRRRLDDGRKKLRQRLTPCMAPVAASLRGATLSTVLSRSDEAIPTSVLALAETASLVTTPKVLALTAFVAMVAVATAAVLPGENPSQIGFPAARRESRSVTSLSPGISARVGIPAFQHGGTGRDAALAFSADGKRLISAAGGRIRGWDATNGRQLFVVGDGRLDAMGERVTAQLTANGSNARLTCWTKHPNDLDSKLPTWTSISYETVRGKEISTSKLDASNDPRRMGVAVPSTLSPQGRYLADISRNGVTLFSATTGDYLRQHRMTNSVYSRMFGTAFHPDDRSILLGDAGHRFTLFDLETGRARRTFQIDAKDSFVDVVAISPDGKWLATAGLTTTPDRIRRDRFIRIWDFEQGKVVRQVELLPQGESVAWLLFTPNSKTLMVVSADHYGKKTVVRTCEVATGISGRSITDDPAIGAIAVRPDAKVLATMNRAGVIRLWDLRTGKELTTP